MSTVVESDPDPRQPVAAPPATALPPARTGSENSASRVRREAIGIHLAFAHMQPLIRRTQHLSLNAIVASARLARRGAPFSIVAQELNTVATDLDGLIHDIERVFRSMVVGIARWGKAELQAEFLARSLRCMEAQAESAPGAGHRTALPAPTTSIPPAVHSGPQAAGAKAESASPADANGDGPRLHPVLERLSRMHDTITEQLDEIDLLTRQLSGRIDRISWVAVRQCHYTSISAQIEAAQISGGQSGLASVAQDIRALADDIAGAEREAKQRATRLRQLLAARLPILRQQVHHG